MRSVIAIVALTALAGCPGRGNGTDLPEGCIMVNGSSGFEFLADALTTVEDGDDVQLCGEITDTIIIDRPLTLSSPFNMEGQFTSLWTPPDNEPAIRVVEGGQVTLDGIYIDTTRNGITVEEGGVLDIQRSFIQVQNPGSYGIEIIGGTVTADNLVINEAFWGAIQNTGGELTLTNSDLINSSRWGVRLDNGASATISDTLIGGTRISDETGANNDGWAVFVCDSCSVVMNDVDLQSNVLGGLYVELGIAEVNGGEWLGNFTSAWIDGGTATITDVDIVDPIRYGVVSLSGNVTLNDVRMDADPEASPFEDPTTNNLEGGYGLLAIDGEVTWIGGGAKEFNGGGIFAQGNQAAQLPLVLQDVSIAANATMGIMTTMTDLEATNVKITGTRSFPEICQANGTFSCDWALGGFQSDIDWVGGSIRDNEAMGAIISDGPSDFTGLELANNALFGIWALQGVVNLIGADIHGSGEVALEMMAGSFLTIEDSIFHDRDDVSVFESGELEFRTAFAATEIEAIGSTVEVNNTTFRSGNRGIFGFQDFTSGNGSNLIITNSTFTDYNRFGAQVSGAGSVLEVDTVTFQNMGGDAIVCSGDAEAALTRVDFLGITKAQNVFETWRDGVLESSSRSTTNLPAIRGNRCQLEASRMTFEDLEGPAIDLNEGTIDELDRINIRGANLGLEPGVFVQPVIDVTWSFEPPEASISGLNISGVPSGVGLKMTSSTPAQDGIASEVRLDGISVGDANGHGGMGIELQGLTDVELTDFSVTGAQGIGVSLTSVAGIIGSEDADSTIVAAAAEGLLIQDSTAAVSFLTISAAAGDGMRVIGGTPTLANVTIDTAGGYGMSCLTDAAAPTCTDVTSDGTSGEHDGCLACFPESVPEP
ncbi:MAG: hypothetical protein ACJAZO_000020 [Myxococcota bacterium]|jgi:hypothetical protein